jgi:hypothetical protein
VEQQPLFFEDVYDVLKYVVQSLGKPKDVGPLLFPHKEDPFAAGRLLSDCINSNRDAKLDIEQIILLLRLAKEKGCHAGIEYLCTAAGYSKPNPIDPKDEQAERQRELIRQLQLTRQLLSRIDPNLAGQL